MIRYDSIQSRLTLVALAMIIGSSLAVGFAGFRLTDRFLSREFHESFKLLAANMAVNAENRHPDATSNTKQRKSTTGRTLMKK